MGDGNYFVELGGRADIGMCWENYNTDNAQPYYKEATEEEAQAMIDAGEEGPFVTEVKREKGALKTNGACIALPKLSAMAGYQWTSGYRVFGNVDFAYEFYPLGHKGDAYLGNPNPISAANVNDVEGPTTTPTEDNIPGPQETTEMFAKKNGLVPTVHFGFGKDRTDFLLGMGYARYRFNKKAQMPVAIPRPEGQISPDGSSVIPLNGQSNLVRNHAWFGELAARYYVFDDEDAKNAGKWYTRLAVNGGLRLSGNGIFGVTNPNLGTSAPTELKSKPEFRVFLGFSVTGHKDIGAAAVADNDADGVPEPEEVTGDFNAKFDECMNQLGLNSVNIDDINGPLHGTNPWEKSWMIDGAKKHETYVLEDADGYPLDNGDNSATRFEDLRRACKDL